MRSLECRRGFKAGVMVNDIITQARQRPSAWSYAQSGRGKNARPGEHQYQAHLAATHPKPQSAVEVRARAGS